MTPVEMHVQRDGRVWLPRGDYVPMLRLGTVRKVGGRWAADCADCAAMEEPSSLGDFRIRRDALWAIAEHWDSFDGPHSNDTVY